MARVGIVGASGYSGGIFTALAARHPGLEVAFATSDKLAGEPVADLALRFRSHEDVPRLAREVDLVVLASSAEHALALMPALEGVRVVDLSGAFRLQAEAYPDAYGFTHPASALLAEAHYGLPELFGAATHDTRLVANPGCYATAALLATAPLVREGLVADDRVIVDGKSGVSGAGRRGEVPYSFVELDDEVRAYKVGKHAHRPEIERHVGRFGARPVRVTFTPHLVPLRRGLLTTVYLTGPAGVTTEQVMAAYERTFAHARFVRLAPVEEVSIHAVAGTPNAVLGASVSGDVIVAVCAIDNLLKGAASQAMQNVNSLLGLEESAGLTSLVRFAP